MGGEDDMSMLRGQAWEVEVEVEGDKNLEYDNRVTPVDLEHTPGTSGDAGVKGRWDVLSLGVGLTPLVGLSSRTQDWAGESRPGCRSLLKIDMPAFRPSPRRAYLLRSSSQSITLMPGSGPPENPPCSNFDAMYGSLGTHTE